MIRQADCQEKDSGVGNDSILVMINIEVCDLGVKNAETLNPTSGDFGLVNFAAFSFSGDRKPRQGTAP